MIDFANVTFTTGVYSITNTVNGRRYVGSASLSFKKRWGEHKAALIAGKHFNRILQRAWNKYGEQAFAFEILLVCDPANCISQEQACIDFYRVNGPGVYNLSPTAGNTLGVKCSPETRAKISAAHSTAEARAKASALRKGMPVSAERRAKQSKAMSGRKLQPLSDEHKAKLSAIHTGRRFTPETIERMRVAQGNRSPEWCARISAGKKGKPLSAEHRKKISVSQKGIKRQPFSAEHCAKISAGKKGWKPSVELRARWSAIRKGRKLTEACKAKIAAAHLGKPGTPWTAEHRAKVMATRARKRDMVMRARR